METAEMLRQFERFTGKFARGAVEAAVARREEVTPGLLRILDETVERAAQIDAEGGYMAHLYAIPTSPACFVASWCGSGPTSGIRLFSYSSDLYAEELLDDIKQAYDEGLVDPSYIGFKHVMEDLALGKDRLLERLAGDPHRQLVSDTVAEIEWWACFREDTPNRATSVAPASANSGVNPVATAAQIKRATPETGRNERCPCGSGKKYKKRCGA